MYTYTVGLFPNIFACLGESRSPWQYEGPVTPHKTWFDVLAECSFGLMGNAQVAEEETPSTVVRIGNVVTAEELTDDNAQREVRPGFVDG